MRRWSLVVLLFAGCSGPPPPSSQRPEDGEAPGVEAESPEWARIAHEAAKGRTVAEQQRLVESEQRYHLALAWFNKGDFDKAKA